MDLFFIRSVRQWQHLDFEFFTLFLGIFLYVLHFLLSNKDLYLHDFKIILMQSLKFIDFKQPDQKILELVLHFLNYLPFLAYSHFGNYPFNQLFLELYILLIHLSLYLFLYVLMNIIALLFKSYFNMFQYLKNFFSNVNIFLLKVLQILS